MFLVAAPPTPRVLRNKPNGGSWAFYTPNTGGGAAQPLWILGQPARQLDLEGYDTTNFENQTLVVSGGFVPKGDVFSLDPFVILGEMRGIIHPGG